MLKIRCKSDQIFSRMEIATESVEKDVILVTDKLTKELKATKLEVSNLNQQIFKLEQSIAAKIEVNDKQLNLTV